jgi:hypothetical protein
MALLGVPKTARLFRLDRASEGFLPVARPDEDGERQIQTTEAFLQTAYELYKNHAWRVSGGGGEGETAARR